MRDCIEVPRWVHEVLTGRGSRWSFGLLMVLMCRSDFAIHRIHAREMMGAAPFDGHPEWTTRRLNNAKRALLRAGVIVPAPNGKPHLYRLNWDAATGRPLAGDLQWAWHRALKRFEDSLLEAAV